MNIRQSWMLLLVGLLLANGCGDGRDDAPSATALDDDAITVGSFDFSESVLLAELYSQALEAAGFRVERAFALGPREFVGPALATGLIELVPEYAGTALGFVSAGALAATTDADGTHTQLERALADRDVTALAAAPAQNVNTFVVTEAFARRHHVERLSDLAPLAPDLTFGGPPECPTRPLCLLGLAERYGLRFRQVLALDAGGPATQQALRTGGVQVALMLSTDPAVSEYVELVDDRRLQPSENVTPLVRDEVIERWGPEVVEVIDGVSGRLRTETLRELNRRDADRPGSADAPAIAAAWLGSEEGS